MDKKADATPLLRVSVFGEVPGQPGQSDGKSYDYTYDGTVWTGPVWNGGEGDGGLTFSGETA